MARLETEAPKPFVTAPRESASRHRDWLAGNIGKVVEEQAVIHPARRAVSCGEVSLTYAQLNARSNQLARTLRRAGAGPGVRIGLFLDRSINTVVSILAVLKTGAAYVPMDPAYPWERLRFIMEDAAVPLVITEKSVAAKLQEATQTVLNLDDAEASLDRESRENLDVHIQPNSPAYVIYTSGSTGKPKGVLVSHRNVLRLFTATEYWFDFNQDDVWTLFHSYGFDFSVWELWGALFYGGRVVVVPYWVSRTPETFYRLLSAENVTVLNQTPSAFRQLIAAEQRRGEALRLSLRYVIFGGEVLDLASLRPWVQRHGAEEPQLINMYGITETTVHVTYRRIRRSDVEHGKGSPIGVPIPDLQVHVLDEQMRPVGPGEQGEIYVGGEGVALGYLDRPELSAERFVSDFFSVSPTARLYKSGDCARVLVNGELEYVGRNDDQVKVHGFRVETGDIESAIREHSAVADCKVVLRKTADAGKQLVAYIIWRNGATDVAAVREAISKRLPAYMVPARFVALKSFPLTTNGKLDRDALPVPSRCRPQLTQPYIGPSTDGEKTLVGVWEQVLNVEPVGVRDSFFELGGDSIRAIQVLARAAKAGFHFTAADLFAEPTIEGLLQLNRTSEPAKTDVSSIGKIEGLPAGVEDAYPMSQLQIGMVYHGKLNAAAAVYHDIFSYRVSSPFDSTKLNQAIQQLAERHPILRTAFDLSRFSQPMQLVFEEVEIPFSVDDIQHLSAAQQDEVVARWFEEEKNNPFDFSRAPLLRWKAHRRGKNSFQLSYSSHHAILDGWSLAAMLTEVIEGYSALLEASDAAVAPRITYKRFVALEQQAVQDETARRFWMERLQDFETTLIPRLTQQEQAKPGEVRVKNVPLPRGVSEKLQTLAAAESLPLKCLLFAAHLKVLSVVTGQRDITTGFVMEGRPDEEDGEKILGLFLNTVPFRMNLAGGTWRELARQVFESVKQMMPYRRYPMAEMQRQIGGARLFETAFDMVHFHVYEKVLGAKSVQFTEDKFFESTNIPFFAFFQVDAATRELSLRFDYHPAEISEVQIDVFAGYYARTLEAIADGLAERYEKFSPLSSDEMTRIREFNQADVDTEIPGDANIVSTIEQACAQYPKGVGLSCSQREYSYSQLNGGSRNIAKTLSENGVKRGDCVGIIARRSAEAVMAIIGVLQAGAAYVPIDPNQPTSRIEAILRQAGISVLIQDDSLSARFSAIAHLDLATLLGRSTTTFVSPPATATDLAYVLFTSGSTGAPKGVQVTHANLVHSTEARLEFYQRPVRSFLLASPHWFDSSMAGIFWTLSQGGELVVPDDDEVKDPAVLARLIASRKISHLLCLPSVYSLLMSYADGLDNLQTVIVAGEECPAELVARHHQLLPKAELYNEYGPTEATVWCSVYKCARRGGKVPIGRPIANTEIYILDDYRRPAPIGAPGEIYIGGAGVARGYLNEPALTLERFLDVDGIGRVYRTGDLGRFLPDGNIEFLGRRDGQIKVRGMRVELSEIENALRQHPAVENCLVALDKSIGREPRLVAYVQAAWRVTAEQLREFLKQLLPAHMVPNAYKFMETFPRTGSGKIDRRALPSITDSLDTEHRAFVAPSTPFEIEIAKIWKEVLQVEKVATNWEFLEAGGHSLTAMQVAARIMDRFHVEIPLAEFFRNATIAQQAAIVLQKLAVPRQPATISREATIPAH